MKKTIYWIFFVPLGFIFCIACIMEGIGYTLQEVIHKWEEWALDYKTRFPHMRYKGEGIWSSVPDKEGVK
jgi:hypothetical protein